MENQDRNPLAPIVAITMLGGLGLVIFVRFISWMNAGIGASSILEALR